MQTQTSDVASLVQLQRDGTRTLKDAGCESAALDARLLLCHAASLSHEALVARSQDEASRKTADAFDSLIARRAQGEPVARILGEKEFWSLSFALGPETLVPRPDSEAIVSAALETVPDRPARLRILDLGTGSGCLLLALLSELPNATGMGIDISRDALGIAARNADALGLADRAQFLQGNWGRALDESFDLVISNPPYIPTGEIESLATEVRTHDPVRALDGGVDGLDCYHQILDDLPRHMKKDASAIFEVSPDLYTELCEMARARGTFEHLEGIKDMAGRWRGLRFGKADLRP